MRLSAAGLTIGKNSTVIAINKTRDKRVGSGHEERVLGDRRGADLIEGKRLLFAWRCSGRPGAGSASRRGSSGSRIYSDCGRASSVNNGTQKAGGDRRSVLRCRWSYTEG